MNIPTLVFGGLIATLYGALFHLVRGGNLGRLLIYIILSWLGFLSGHFLAQRFDLRFFSIGSLNLGIATIGSLLFLVLGYWIFFGRASAE
jgi:hypothetical protein